MEEDGGWRMEDGGRGEGGRREGNKRIDATNEAGGLFERRQPRAFFSVVLRLTQEVEEEEPEEPEEPEEVEEEEEEEEFAIRMAVKEVQMATVGCLNIANCKLTFPQNIFYGNHLLLLFTSPSFAPSFAPSFSPSISIINQMATSPHTDINTRSGSVPLAVDDSAPLNLIQLE